MWLAQRRIGQASSHSAPECWLYARSGSETSAPLRNNRVRLHVHRHVGDAASLVNRGLPSPVDGASKRRDRLQMGCRISILSFFHRGCHPSLFRVHSSVHSDQHRLIISPLPSSPCTICRACVADALRAAFDWFDY
jgi:hypothetical protein